MHSEKNKSCLKEQTKLKSAIDELWELMQIPKHSYNIMKKEVQCGIIWKVNNDEGKYNGVLQHKVWNHGRLQPKKNEDGEAYGQQQTKFWDPGRQKLQMHNQEVMILFYFGIMMLSISSQGQILNL